MLVRSIATEKAYHEQTKRTYMFNVPASASKQAVARQVADQYNVTVLGVRIVIRKGKATRFSRGKHAYPGTTATRLRSLTKKNQLKKLKLIRKLKKQP